MKLVHLVGFIIKKFVPMHGHMKVKKIYIFVKTCPHFGERLEPNLTE